MFIVKKILQGMLLSVFVALGAASSAIAATPAAVLDSICKSDSGSENKFRERLLNEVVVDASLRNALVAALSSGGGERCRSTLTTYFKEQSLEKAKNVNEKGRLTLLLLGLAGKIPEVTPLVEYEIDRMGNLELLDSLRTMNHTSYRHFLENWIEKAAHEIRVAQKIVRTDETRAYQTSAANGQTKGEDVKLVSPWILERYLKELKSSSTAPRKTELESLNALFAGTTAGYRQILEAPLKDILRKNTYAWIETFRQEPIWVQVRLLSIMTSVGGPDVARELLWISKNHADIRLRSLADRSLDEMVDKKK